MKRISWMVRCMVMVFLAMSWQVLAAGEVGGRNFNHISTGFPLSGGHASAACETCHNGGVFKGTPRNCDGCHALGRRIVATPKSNSHIITDAPCESCHFNSVTWLGARFNHGTAKIGQCVTCHNGRISTGKPASHTDPRYSYSCDQCHRSSAWYPNTWNHTDTTSDCVSCHKAGGPGRNYASAIHNPMVLGAVSSCRSCHKNYYSFYSAFYDHAGVSISSCDSCHGNAAYVGVKQKISAIHPVAASMSLTCHSCHKSFTSFGNAKFDHAVASPACNTCHGTYNAPLYTGVPAPTSAIHGALASLPVTTTCNSCHKSFGTFSGARFDHAGATQCSVCHSGAYSAAGIRGKSSGHIAYLSSTPSTPECSACHSTSSWGSTVSGLSLHIYLTTQTVSHTPTCRSCHAGAAHDGKDGANASMDCSRSGCHDPLGSKGSLYQNWD